MSRYPQRIVCLTEETTETLYLLGQGDYRRRISRTHDVKGIAVSGILLLLAPIAGGLSALFVTALVAVYKALGGGVPVTNAK